MGNHMGGGRQHRRAHRRPESDSLGQTGDLPKALDQLTTAAAASVPGAQYAGITVSSRQNEVGTPSVSHRYPGILDEIQRRHLEGPCLQAAWSRETVIVDDLDSDHRWPRYRRDALAQTPVRSIASLPIVADELLMGALNIFAEATHVFDEKALETARIFAVLGVLPGAMSFASSNSNRHCLPVTSSAKPRAF